MKIQFELGDKCPHCDEQLTDNDEIYDDECHTCECKLSDQTTYKITKELT